MALHRRRRYVPGYWKIRSLTAHVALPGKRRNAGARYGWLSALLLLLLLLLLATAFLILGGSASNDEWFPARIYVWIRDLLERLTA